MNIALSIFSLESQSNLLDRVAKSPGRLTPSCNAPNGPHTPFNYTLFVIVNGRVLARMAGRKICRPNVGCTKVSSRWVLAALNNPMDLTKRGNG